MSLTNSSLHSNRGRSSVLHCDPFLSRLNQRLDQAEHSFLLACFNQSINQCEDILHELITLTSSHSYSNPPGQSIKLNEFSNGPSNSLLSQSSISPTNQSNKQSAPGPLCVPPHECASDCVCEATIALLIQSTIQSIKQSNNQTTTVPSASQLKSLNESINQSIGRIAVQYYGSLEGFPLSCLALSLSCWREMKQYGKICALIARWLEHRPSINQSIYQSLMHTLIFQALLPMNESYVALVLLRRNERLDKQVREEWIDKIEQLNNQSDHQSIKLDDSTFSNTLISNIQAGTQTGNDQSVNQSINQSNNQSNNQTNRTQVFPLTSSSSQTNSTSAVQAHNQSINQSINQNNESSSSWMSQNSTRFHQLINQLITMSVTHRRVIISFCFIYLLIKSRRLIGRSLPSMNWMTESPLMQGLKGEARLLVEFVLASGLGRLFLG